MPWSTGAAKHWPFGRDPHARWPIFFPALADSRRRSSARRVRIFLSVLTDKIFCAACSRPLAHGPPRPTSAHAQRLLMHGQRCSQYLHAVSLYKLKKVIATEPNILTKFWLYHRVSHNKSFKTRSHMNIFDKILLTNIYLMKMEHFRLLSRDNVLDSKNNVLDS